MKSSVYEDIICCLSKYKREDLLDHLAATFPDVEVAQLECIVNLEIQKKVKKSYYHYTQPSVVQKIYAKYSESVLNNEAPGIILRMAKHYNYSSAMMAKLILEHFLLLESAKEQSNLQSTIMEDCEDLGTTPIPKTPPMSPTPDQSTTEDVSAVKSSDDSPIAACSQASVSDNDVERPVLSLKQTVNTSNNSVKDSAKGVGKSKVNKLFRDTSLIPDKVLSMEVHMCLVEDPTYGPYADTIKHSLGHEYEVLLCRKLEEMQISYKTEDDLRVMGFDKTPDVKLDVPIGVNGRVVNWIESKAAFGDRESHKTYLKEQFRSYWNRFGPGLVIYWFGFLDELDVLEQEGIMMMDSFPSDFVFLDPLSESLVGRDFAF